MVLTTKFEPASRLSVRGGEPGNLRVAFDNQQKRMGMRITNGSRLGSRLIATAALIGASMTIIAPAHALNANDTSVQMFRWKWNDIAYECEAFLGPQGYGAVQVSPPTAAANLGTWYDVYQPVNYTKLDSAMGTEAQFTSMINKCHAAGVRVYADVVVNQLAAGAGTATDGSSWDANALRYPNFSANDFHGKCTIVSSDYAYNRSNILNCRLSGGMPDLNTGRSYVQTQIRNYLNKLHALGVDGIRIDAAKHMSPSDISAFLQGVSRETTMKEQMWITQEVIGDDSSYAADYLGNGAVNEFKYAYAMKRMFRKDDGANISQIQKIMGSSDNWGGSNMFISDSAKATVFVNNWDTERGGSNGSTSLNASNHVQGMTNDAAGTWRYSLANILMLGWPYGHAQVHSGFGFTNKNQGPPSDSPYEKGAARMGSSTSWDFIHRWNEIANMVYLRATTSGADVRNFTIGTYDQIAFSRGTRGFVAINNDASKVFSASIQTSLPPGVYCNVVHGKLIDSTNACASDSVTIGSDGKANIHLAANNSNTSTVPAVALHVNQKVR